MLTREIKFLQYRHNLSERSLKNLAALFLVNKGILSVESAHSLSFCQYALQGSN